MARDEIKESIISKARELIKNNGGFTIKELTDATHVNIAAVNYHFGSKDNLTKTILEDVLIDLKRVLMFFIDKLEAETSREAFIREIVNVIYDFTVQNANLLNYIFRTLDTNKLNTKEMISQFIDPKEVSNTIYKNLAKLIGSDDPKEILARYIGFFATAITPMIVQAFQSRDLVNDLFNDKAFREIYINQMMKLLK